MANRVVDGSLLKHSGKIVSDTSVYPVEGV